MAAHNPVPIAIIGTACRLPGNVTHSEQLWQLLAAGLNAWSPVPPERFNEAAFYHPWPQNDGTTNHRGGHFLNQDIAAFDASFFKVSTLEAQAMDPQQRLLLEVTYETFENASVPIETARGSNTSVYVATFTHDYDRNMYKDPSNIPRYHVTGSGDAIVSNRISYTFDLKGPSVTMDTGCSGSMVALHQACQSLRTMESDMALVSGVSLILSPDHMIGMSNLNMLNGQGRSYPYDARGSGYGRGEGVVTVLLKRLDDALQAGDSIRAIIRNTSVNQDGKTSGITLPSGQAQADLHNSAHDAVGINPFDISYLEGHGTGTAAGDEAELQGIVKVLCGNARRPQPLFLGSIKSNIGHLESASGLAGLLKTVLALEKGLIPPNADFQTGKPILKLEEWNVKVPTKLEPWPTPGTRRAAVNSFGYGGTNAYAILESYPISDARSLNLEFKSLVPKSVPPTIRDRNGLANDGRRTTADTAKPNTNVSSMSSEIGKSQLFVLSAGTQKAILDLVERYRRWTDACVDLGHCLPDLAYTLSNRRSFMRWRVSLVAKSGQELTELLSQSSLRVRKVVEKRQIVFVFTGQGAQWAGMGSSLLRTNSRFAKSIAESDVILREMGASWNLLDELQKHQTKSRLSESCIAQPASTALQVALVDLLVAFGISPQVVLGHSSGEIGAAYAAGIVSHRTALQIAYHRSFISDFCRGKDQDKGAMLAVGLSEDKVRPFLAETLGKRVSVACINSPSSTTISGDEAAILELSNTFSRLEILNSRLKVDTAYHSHHMYRAAPYYLQSLGTIQTQSLRAGVRFISTVTAEEKSEDFGAAYWVENLVSKVRFYEALRNFFQAEVENCDGPEIQPTHIILEIGTHKVLETPIRQTINQVPGHLDHEYIPTLIRGRDAVHTILETTARMFDLGQPVKLFMANGLHHAQHQRYILGNLPTYPWDHSITYWHESRLSKEYRLRKHGVHDLLGIRTTDRPSLEPSWRHTVSIGALPWLADHVVDGLVIFPGAGYLCMAIEASSQILDDSQPHATVRRMIIRNASFIKTLVIPPATKVEIQLCSRLHRTKNALYNDFRIYALSQDEVWHEHCRGQIVTDLTAESSFPLSAKGHPARDVLLHNLRTNAFEEQGSQTIYRRLGSNHEGNFYGPCFAVIDKLWMGYSQAVAEIHIPDIKSVMPSNFQRQHIIHPTTMDAVMHAALPTCIDRYGLRSIVPVTIQEIEISPSIASTPGTRLLAAVNLDSQEKQVATADISVFTADETNQDPVLRIRLAQLRGLAAGSSLEDSHSAADFQSYEMIWLPDIDYLTLEADKNPSTISARSFLGYLGFKQSNMSILEIGAINGKNSARIIEAFGDGANIPITSYTITDEESFIDAQNHTKDLDVRIQFEALDIQKHLFEPRLTEHAFDIIIAHSAILTRSSADYALTNIRCLLKPDGRLICKEESMPDGYGIGDLLLQHAFNGVELYLEDAKSISETSLMVVSKAIDINIRKPIRSLNLVVSQGLETFAKLLIPALREYGFQICIKTWTSELSEDEAVHIVLDDGEKPLLWKESSDQFQYMSRLVRGKSNILWISAQEGETNAMNPLKGLMTGFARSARAENEDLNLVALDVQEAIGGCLPRLLQVIGNIITASFRGQRQSPSLVETEYAYRDSQVLIPRLILSAKVQNWISGKDCRSEEEGRASWGSSSLLMLNIESTGSNESLYLVDEQAMQQPLESSMVEIAVRAQSLESMVTTHGPRAMGEIAHIRGLSGIVNGLGHRASGRLRIGERVCAWIYDKEVCTNYVRLDCENVYPLDLSIPFTMGAALPVPFMTAYYAISEIAHLERGQTIYIHGATSDVGQAAIDIASHIGAQVIASACTEAEQEQLNVHFGLQPSNIVSENDLSLSRIINEITDGEGVAVVLNLLTTDLSSDLCKCVAPLGFLIQIGPPTLARESSVAFASNKYSTNVLFDLATVIKHRPQKLANIFSNVMSILRTKEHIHLHSIKIMPMASIGVTRRAIRNQGNSAKTIYEADEDTVVRTISRLGARTPLRRIKLDGNATYVIAGGLGDLGKKLSRFIASCGAKAIVLLSRTKLTTYASQCLEEELRLLSAGLQLCTISCDIADESMVRSVLFEMEKMALPPVKGVIHSAAVLHDRVLEHMTEHDFYIPLDTKVRGTQYLSEAFNSAALEFFILLSSLSGIVGSRGQVNYAAGSTYQDAFANCQRTSDAKFFALDIGMVEDSGTYQNDKGQVRVNNLLRQGFKWVKTEELLQLVGYSISLEARNHECRQFVTGIDGRSIRDSLNSTPTMRSPMFTHVRQPDTARESRNDTSSSTIRKELIAMSKSSEEMLMFISAAIRQQLFNITASDPAMLSLASPLVDLGLDSLLAIEMKNWISLEFEAPIQASEILDESSVPALSLKVASRSKLIARVDSEDGRGAGATDIQNPDGNPKPKMLQSGHANEAKHEAKLNTSLPRLPLPDLRTTLSLYLSCARPFLTEKQFRDTFTAAEKFEKEDGEQLQRRLMYRNGNPKIENWQDNLYVRSIYLKRRDPVHPYGTFYGSHILTETLHDQAERAAVISLAAFAFKRQLDAGSVEPLQINEEPACMESLNWLFNTTREPAVGADKICRYPGNNYLMVLRRGHIFKVELAEKGKPVTYLTLRAKFQSIINSTIESRSPVAALSAADRDSWAKFRGIIQAISTENSALLKMIEASAFIMCLDDGSPQTQSQRCNQFLLGDPGNRWSDKSLQFVVCDNGVSGYICEHSMLDAISSKQINHSITQAIFEHEHGAQSSHQVKELMEDFEEYSFTTNPLVDSQIDLVRQHFEMAYSPAEVTNFQLENFGSKFLRDYKVPSKTGLQLVIQLASLIYFGEQHASWETLTMMLFRKGRLDWMQVVSTAMFEFCKAATTCDKSDLKIAQLLRDAANAHTTTMTKVARGHGFAAHLEALHEVLQENEPVPNLFTDATWAKMHVTSTRKLKTDASEDLRVQEAGFFMPDPESVLVHYEVEESRTRFIIQSTEGRTANFAETIKSAMERVKHLLEIYGERPDLYAAPSFSTSSARERKRKP